MQHFSLAIIGSGSGNILVPDDDAQGPVALIEAGAFGGTCLNRGCIPSKILVHTADVAVQARTASDFGIDAEVNAVDWPSIRDRTFSKIDRVSAKGRKFRAESGHVTLFEGRAHFTGPRELVIDGTTGITADRVVVATGGRPTIPPVIADAGVEFWTSDNIMRIDELPASMVIVGGGPVAAEFAHIFSEPGRRDSHRQPRGHAAGEARHRRLRPLHRSGPGSAGTSTSRPRSPVCTAPMRAGRRSSSTTAPR